MKTRYDLTALKTPCHLLTFIGISETDFKRVSDFNSLSYEQSIKDDDKKGILGSSLIQLFWRMIYQKRTHLVGEGLFGKPTKN
ncbi:MAG: hypothetical protein AAFY41_09715 [Bacteroidota bacterium]